MITWIMLFQPAKVENASKERNLHRDSVNEQGIQLSFGITKNQMLSRIFNLVMHNVVKWPNIL